MMSSCTTAPANTIETIKCIIKHLEVILRRLHPAFDVVLCDIQMVTVIKISHNVTIGRRCKGTIRSITAVYLSKQKIQQGFVVWWTPLKLLWR